MSQTAPRTKLTAHLKNWERGFIPPEYRAVCHVCGGLLDTRETHEAFISGKRAHNQCHRKEALARAVQDQSSFL